MTQELTPAVVGAWLDHLMFPAASLGFAIFGLCRLGKIWRWAKQGTAYTAVALAVFYLIALVMLNATPLNLPDEWANSPIHGFWAFVFAVAVWPLTYAIPTTFSVLVLMVVAIYKAVHVHLGQSPGPEWPDGVTRRDMLRRWWEIQRLSRRLQIFLREHVRAKYGPDAAVIKGTAHIFMFAVTFFEVKPSTDLGEIRAAVASEFSEITAIGGIEIGTAPWGSPALVVKWW